METKTINIYKFKELKKAIKEKVLNDFREMEQHEYLEESLTEELKEVLKKKKLSCDDLNVLYSLSCCQGDGFCFTGIIKGKNAEIKITHNSRYYHSQSVDIEIISLRVGKNFIDCYDLNEKQQKRADFILTQLKEQYQKICFELEKLGYAYIDDALKDEVIIENINVNEYTFRENGEIEFI